MKKFFATLLMLAVTLTSTVALAAFREEIPENADITSIKRLAIALPMHYKMEVTEPTLDEFITIIFDAGRISHCEIISYDKIAENILDDTGIDIIALQDADSRKTYNSNISKYADAFLVVTTANNNKRTQFFFDVYNSNSGELLYRLTTQGGGIGKNSKDYAKACTDFYQKFNAAVEKTIKDAQKQAKKKNK